MQIDNNIGRKKRRKVFFILFLLLAIFFLSNFLGFTTYLKENIYKPVNLLASRVFYISSSLKNEGEGGEEETYEELKSRLNKLMVENARLRSAYDENQRLRDFLNFSKNDEYENKIANVISPGFDNDRKIRTSLIIDRGASDGIRPGMPVINSDGLLIGKILETKTDISKVALVTNDQCKLAATVRVGDGTLGVLEGNLGLTMKMDFIPQASRVDKGMLVSTSGLEKDIEKGFLVGKIIEVRNDKNEMWKQAIAEPIANLENISMVGVLVRKESTPQGK